MSSVPPQPAIALAPGYRLDRYEFLCPIAEGGMGVCWLARMIGKHGFQKLVAIKTMKAEYATDAVFQQMFLDEARIASRIEHANVAQILDLGEEKGVLYLAMEYVDGDSIAKLQREVVKKSLAIPPGIVSRLLADTCAGLHAAHELADENGKPLGVVHRDVSPQNVLVTVKGAVKLIDFGIAKARDRTSGDTSTGTIKGKIHYMAPEQALAHGDIDRRADIFSVGAILYQLLSGKRAFEAETQVATILLLASGRPPLPLPRSVPPALAAVVLRALSHAKAQRYATALEMQQALEEAMIKAELVTTTSAVAAYLAEHLGHRSQSRKKATDVALRLVNSGVFDMPAPMSSPTIGSSMTGTPAGLPQGVQATGPGGPFGLDEGGPGATLVAPSAPDGVKHAALMAVLALNTEGGGSPTLATLAASSVSQGVTPPPRRRLVPLIVWIAGPALALVGVVLTFLALRHGAAPVARQAGPPASEAPSATTNEPPAPPHSAAAEIASVAAAQPLTPFTRASASARPVTGATPTAAARVGASPLAAKPPVVAGTPPTATTTTTKKKADEDGF